MKKIITLLTFLLFYTVSINAEENKKLPDNCVNEYKISPKALGCGVKKGFSKIYTKKDGSLNILGKFFNAKSLSDIK